MKGKNIFGIGRPDNTIKEADETNNSRTFVAEVK